MSIPFPLHRARKKSVMHVFSIPQPLHRARNKVSCLSSVYIISMILLRRVVVFTVMSKQLTQSTESTQVYCYIEVCVVLRTRIEMHVSHMCSSGDIYRPIIAY